MDIKFRVLSFAGNSIGQIIQPRRRLRRRGWCSHCQKVIDVASGERSSVKLEWRSFQSRRTDHSYVFSGHGQLRLKDRKLSVMRQHILERET
jgi:hypothetical protein